MRVGVRRAWVAGIGLVTLGALLAWAFRPPAVDADLAVVARGSFAVTVDDEGETRVRERFVVSAPVAGRVLRIALDAGDPVVANETVLATFVPLDPAPLDARTRAEAAARVETAVAALGTARAERDRVAADLAFARRDLARKRELLAGGAVSLEQVEQADRAVRMLEESARGAGASVDAHVHQVQAARAALVQIGSAGRGSTWRLRSPITGSVLRCVQESERVVAAGEPLVEVGDVTRLEVVTDLLSRDAARVAAGQAVMIEGWGGPPLGGRVRRVEPSGFTKISALGIEEQRVNVIVDVDPLPPGTPIGDGYRVDVRIVTSRREGVLTLPLGGVFRDGDGWAAFAVRGGRAVKTPVTLGGRNGTVVEVVTGVADGDRVVLYPGDAVVDGVRVRAR